MVNCAVLNEPQIFWNHVQVAFCTRKQQLETPIYYSVHLSLDMVTFVSSTNQLWFVCVVSLLTPWQPPIILWMIHRVANQFSHYMDPMLFTDFTWVILYHQQLQNNIHPAQNHSFGMTIITWSMTSMSKPNEFILWFFTNFYYFIFVIPSRPFQFEQLMVHCDCLA